MSVGASNKEEILLYIQQQQQSLTLYNNILKLNSFTLTVSAKTICGRGGVRGGGDNVTDIPLRGCRKLAQPWWSIGGKNTKVVSSRKPVLIVGQIEW